MRGGVLWALPCPSCAPGLGWNWAVLRLRSLLADCGFAPSRGRGLGRCGSIARVGTRAPAQTAPPRLPTGSDLERFDRAVWQDPRSADYVPGDVTPTTKDAGGRCEERPAG